MALPTVVGAGTVATATTGTSIPGMPTGWAADDIHLVFIETSETTAPAAMSGWADVVTSQTVGSGTTLTRLTVRWRRAVAGDTAPTVPAATNHTISRILGIRGVDTGAVPWNITSSGINATSSTAVSIPGATTTVDECLVVAAFSTGTDTATAQLSGSFANASLASLATQVNDWTASGGGGGLAVATGTLAVRGAYAATTATLLTAAVKAFMTVALAPVASTQVAATPIVLQRSPRPVERQQFVGPTVEPTPSSIIGG